MKWEYKIAYLTTDGDDWCIDRDLNRHGYDGWELVSLMGTKAIFKRPIIE